MNAGKLFKLRLFRRGCGGGLLSFVPDTLLACMITMWSNNQLLLNIVILLSCPGF